MITIGDIQSERGCRFVLTPNCSISWQHTVIFYLVTCCLAFTIALLFCLQGQWLILPFSGLEMLVLGVALYVTSRKAHYREVITAGDKRIKIEKGIHRISEEWVFDRSWVRLIDEPSGRQQRRRKIALGSHGNYVEVGEFLTDMEKDELAFRLKGCIIRA